MNRRKFLSTTGTVGLATLVAESAAFPPSQAAILQNPCTAGSHPGPVLTASPMVSGPAAESMTILQPLQCHATGYLEYALDDGPYHRVDTATAGLLPFEEHVLKFRLPPLPAGRTVRYRVTARSIGWVPVREFVYGKIIQGNSETGPEHSFRTLDPSADTTRFVVWNDTHENETTIRLLRKRTSALQPDFLLWNGDQSNDIHLERKMCDQFVSPIEHPIANLWPIAYVRGNHDVRGPAARRLAKFTGTPEDRFYYGFRSGPLAALVMDTGEDKDDDSPYLGGITAFATMRAEQTAWLEKVVEEPWFKNAPFKVLFCHIPLWWIRDRKDIEWREFAKPSRDAWLPALTKAGVQLVVSGHTHSPVWMPAKDGQPIGQLIGGAPQTKDATLIHGTADSGTLTITMSKLDDAVVAAVELRS